MKRFTVLYRNYHEFFEYMEKSTANDYTHYRIKVRKTGEDDKYTTLLLMNSNEERIYNLTEKNSVYEEDNDEIYETEDNDDWDDDEDW